MHSGPGSFVKTLEKGGIARKEQFLLFATVFSIHSSNFLPFSSYLKLFQFGRIQNSSFGKELGVNPFGTLAEITGFCDCIDQDQTAQSIQSGLGIYAICLLNRTCVIQLFSGLNGSYLQLSIEVFVMYLVREDLHSPNLLKYKYLTSYFAIKCCE